MKGICDRDEAELKLALQHVDEIGSEYANNHYPTGWANAGNTPFQWYKIWPHEGGIKDPLIIRYPQLITQPGAVCGQYHHVSDITPTILDIIGKDKPKILRGVPQQPFSGISMKYTLLDASAPDRKHVTNDVTVYLNRTSKETNVCYLVPEIVLADFHFIYRITI